MPLARWRCSCCSMRCCFSPAFSDWLRVPVDILTRWPVLLAITVTATVVWAGAIEIGGDLAALLPLGVMAALAGGWICWQAVLRHGWALLTILVIDVLVLCLVFRKRDVGDTGL